MYLAGKPRRIGKYRLKVHGHIRFAGEGQQEEDFIVNRKESGSNSGNNKKRLREHLAKR